MADVSLVIKSKVGTGDEKTATTTIPNVNPEATNAELYNLGYKFSTFIASVNSSIITKQTNEILSGGE